jgi:uncharacterized protein (TIGR02118 family)
MAKLMFCLRRLPQLSRVQFQDYWRNVHAPLVRARADALGLLGYVQSHALPDEAGGRVVSERGGPPGFDGVAQLWWRDLSERTPAQKAAARQANAELLADERRFIDLAASPIFLVEEHEVLREFVQSRQA